MDLQTKALFSSYGYFDLQWRLLVSLESCVVSSVRTNFLYSTYDLALHQSACYLLAIKSRKRVNSSLPESSHPWTSTSCTVIIVRMRKNPISAFCEVCTSLDSRPSFITVRRTTRFAYNRYKSENSAWDRGWSAHDLVILVSHNAQNSFLWLEDLTIYIHVQCLCLVIYPWHYSLTGSAKYFSNDYYLSFVT